jgi:hypothetical protein
MPDEGTGGTGLSFSNLTGLEKPATELINRVSDAVGGIAKPWHIKRVAKAEAEAKKIAAIADIEISEIQQRAIKRMVLEEEKNQENIEAITSKAIPHLSADAKPEELDQDFVRYLFEKARLVSDEEMQGIWAKILAGEANKAGSFSRRTMELVSHLSTEEAERFTRFCRQAWRCPHLFAFMPVGPTAHRSSNDWGFSFEELTDLEAAGLIRLDMGYVEPIDEKHKLIEYFGCPVEIFFNGRPLNPERGNEIETGQAIFTSSGRELAEIAGAKPSHEYFRICLGELVFQQGISVSIPIEAKEAYKRVDPARA